LCCSSSSSLYRIACCFCFFLGGAIGAGVGCAARSSARSLAAQAARTALCSNRAPNKQLPRPRHRARQSRRLLELLGQQQIAVGIAARSAASAVPARCVWRDF
jgi:hypothetical protein